MDNNSTNFLGSLQYKGKWSPIKEDAEVSNDGSVDYLHQIENQNPWPTGHGDEYYDETGYGTKSKLNLRHLS